MRPKNKPISNADDTRHRTDTQAYFVYLGKRVKRRVLKKKEAKLHKMKVKKCIAKYDVSNQGLLSFNQDRVHVYMET